MKKIVITTIILIFTPFVVQGQNKNILKSNDIKEIEKYLNTAHPDDPKSPILKRKIITLKNEAWTKGRKDAKPMPARPINSDCSQLNNTTKEEEEEFKKAMIETPEQHQKKTILLLNTIFNEHSENKETVLKVINHSECNIILRIKGKQNYALPIPAHKENVLIINKGRYILNSKVCEAEYRSEKNITKSIEINIIKN